MKPQISIDVVSDIVCPWCYIGKRRMEKAIHKLANVYDFEIKYHPFELNPNIPSTGTDQRLYLTQKFGSESRYKQIVKHVTEVAAQEGLFFDFEKQGVSPNTRKAHGIIQYAATESRQAETLEAFFSAYFTEGVDLSQDSNVLEVAVKAGLSRDMVKKILNDETTMLHVVMEQQEIHRRGISGVPFYTINNRYGISGAQPSEVFAQVFEKAGGDIKAKGNVDTKTV